MPDLLIRKLPPELHDRLKAAAVVHRRSVNQETIATLERGLNTSGQVAVSNLSNLPEPLIPSRPITMMETLEYIREGRP